MNPHQTSESADTTGRERRGKPRIRIPLPVTVRGADENGKPIEWNTRVENISTSGLYMKMAQRVAAGTALLVVVNFAQPAETITNPAGIVAHGNVVRSELRQDGSCGVALHFSGYRTL